MTVNTDWMRADMPAEDKRFPWQVVASMGAAAGGGATVLAWLRHLMGKIERRRRNATQAIQPGGRLTRRGMPRKPCGDDWGMSE